MIIALSALVLMIGISLIVTGYIEVSEGMIFSGFLISLISVLVGFGMCGSLIIVDKKVTNIENFEIARTKSAVVLDTGEDIYWSRNIKIYNTENEELVIKKTDKLNSYNNSIFTDYEIITNNNKQGGNQDE